MALAFPLGFLPPLLFLPADLTSTGLLAAAALGLLALFALGLLAAFALGLLGALALGVFAAFSELAGAVASALLEIYTTTSSALQADSAYVIICHDTGFLLGLRLTMDTCCSAPGA